MYTHRRITAALCGAFVMASSAVLAANPSLSTDRRDASQTDKTITLGGGTVSESELLPRGLRLASPAVNEGADEAVATAVYLFKVPLAATTFTIEVGYRANAQPKRDETVGFLFVRTSGATANRPIEPQTRPMPRKNDPDPSGDLYPLKGDETTASVTVPFRNRVVDGTLEVRLTARAGQAFDAEYVQVISHPYAGTYANVRGYQVPPVPSGRAYDPLNYQQQPPQTFYGVPNLWPNLYGAGHADSQDPIFWRQIWLMQAPHSAYQYPYLYYGRGGHDHKPHKKK